MGTSDAFALRSAASRDLLAKFKVPFYVLRVLLLLAGAWAGIKPSCAIKLS